MNDLDFTIYFIKLFVMLIGVPIIVVLIINKLTFDVNKAPSCYQPKIFSRSK